MPPVVRTPAQFAVGCATEVITPPVGCPMAGYFHERIALRVRDDLCARAMVIGDGQTWLVVVGLDLIGIDADFAFEAKRAIGEHLGIPASHVVFSATHTHTGPEFRRDSSVPSMPREWLSELPGRVVRAVERAAERAVPATLRAGQTTVEGYSFNRLSRQRDGTETFGSDANTVGPAGPIDTEMTTLSAVAEDGRLLGMLCNFALHVDVIGGGGAQELSADWPGEMARNISAVYGDDTVCVLLQGTCGDINHCPRGSTQLPTGGPAKAVQLGRALAGAAMVASERAEPTGCGRLAALDRTLEIPYFTRDDAFRAELGRIEAIPPADRAYFEQALLDVAATWSHDGEVAQVPLQCLRIGDLALVALPGEVFVRLGLEIKHWSPAAHTMVVELTSGRVCTYIPTTDQAGRGAYGAKPILSRWLVDDAGRRLADAAQVMLCELWAEQTEGDSR